MGGVLEDLSACDRSARGQLALLTHNAFWIARKAGYRHVADLVTRPLTHLEYEVDLLVIVLARLAAGNRHLCVEIAVVAVYLLYPCGALRQLGLGYRGISEPAYRIPPRIVANCVANLRLIDGSLARLPALGTPPRYVLKMSRILKPVVAHLLATTLIDHERDRAVVAVRNLCDDWRNLRIEEILLHICQTNLVCGSCEIALAVLEAVLELRLLGDARFAEEIATCNYHRRLIAHLAAYDEGNLVTIAHILRIGIDVLEIA